ncbi:MAG: DUF1214 domain-containing protein [Luteolibacter sp.]
MKRMPLSFSLIWMAALGSLLGALPGAAGTEPLLVNAGNFTRAETDLYFGNTVKDGGFGKLVHAREMTPIDQQKVVRMNRDTIYSSGVFDLDAAPLTIILPEAGKRFMSMQVVSEDHYTLEVAHGAGKHEYTREAVGTRYVFIIIRTLADPGDLADMKAAHALQDAIQVQQARTGKWEVPVWDPGSQKKVRDALAVLGSMHNDGMDAMFGAKGEVDPVSHLIGTAIGWGGNPKSAAMYTSAYPDPNDGKTAFELTVKDAPVDGFWSVTVYNKDGYFTPNDLGRYSFNNLTAKPSADGSVTIQFGGDPKGAANYLPITPGWNYTVRLYRPRAEILEGKWKFPAAEVMEAP